MDHSREEYIQEMLKPLHLDKSSAEYFHQYQAMVDFDRCLQGLEARYGSLFEQLLSLEKKLSFHP